MKLRVIFFKFTFSLSLFQFPIVRRNEKNLRSVFVRKLKPARSGSSAKSKKHYYLNETMQFLLPFVKPNAPNTDSQGNVTSLPPDKDKSGSEDDVDCDKVDKCLRCRQVSKKLSQH
jgi:hypothetical protein